MITGDLNFRMPFEAYRISVLVPAMSRKKIKEAGYSEEKPALARMNWGNWIWDCECGGAEFVFEAGWGMCQSCFNSGHGHKYRKVIMPKQRKALEEEMLKRPLMHRNWHPSESLAKIKAENATHKAELVGG